ADKKATLWTLDGQRHKTFTGHYDRVVDVSFSPDSKILATASDDKTARLWTVVDSKQKPIVLKGHDDEVNGISFSPDGKLIATASDDQTIRLWNHKGKQIATASDDQTIRLWNHKGKQITKPKAHDERVLGITFSPNGNKLASASFDKTVKLWTLNDLGHGKLDVTLLQTFKGHDDWVWNVSFSKDGKTLASASSDHTVKRWKVDSQKIQSSKLDDLQKLGCENLRDYLKTNIKVSPEDRHLCDGI
ncbi:WD40 repeat domain-containing protein, partial [Nostoc sp. 106C]|uniref:WD40 repeat domain-containing protein n=1 Tax=Nostoc sp. 106C TaxID=1932667 RepID=UPI000A3AC5C9